MGGRLKPGQADRRAGGRDIGTCPSFRLSVLPSLGLLFLFGATALPAQVPLGDSAWVAGDFHLARIAYERALAEDSTSVRAHYRLGILASWDGRLDSALVLIRKARVAEPRDPDLRIAEARILAWAARYPASLALYDSVLADHPDRADAALGRAETLAWANRFVQSDSAYAGILAGDPGNLSARIGRARLTSWRGRLNQAIAMYQSVLHDDPRNLDALAGLGQVYLWQGRASRAAAYADTALTVDPAHKPALELARNARRARRPQPELSTGWSNDSDHNTNWWQVLSVSVPVTDPVRAFASIGLLQASDPVRSADRTMGEAGASYASGNARVSAALGARSLSPDGAAGRTSATWRAGAGYRFSPSLNAGIGYAHYPFDETAFLITGDLDLDAVDGSVDYLVRRGTTLSAGGGAAWFSDGNYRTAGILALNQELGRGFYAGAMGRRLSYDFKGVGYFSPDRFSVAEARGGYGFSNSRWNARASAGLGIQQVTRDGVTQSQWHIELRAGHTWGLDNSVEGFAGYSTSAESSTTGAFKWGTAGIILRIGL